MEEYAREPWYGDGTGLGTGPAAPRPAAGGGRGRHWPHSATAQTPEPLSLPVPAFGPSHSGSVKRGPHAPGEGAAQDAPLL